jgi:hypothetical protein
MSKTATPIKHGIRSPMNATVIGGFKVPPVAATTTMKLANNIRSPGGMGKTHK